MQFLTKTPMIAQEQQSIAANYLMYRAKAILEWSEYDRLLRIVNFGPPPPPARWSSLAHYSSPALSHPSHTHTNTPLGYSRTLGATAQLTAAAVVCR